MGLAGRRVKQRIGADPRNLTWADDAAKFGQAYLSKMGWDPSKGLGMNADGRTSHVKVRQKLDALGIGAGQRRGDVAWNQSRDYEALLMRLNAASEAAAEEDKGEENEIEDEDEIDNEDEEGKDGEGPGGVREDEETSRKRKKRKKSEKGDLDDGEDRRKKRKKESKEKMRTKEKSKVKEKGKNKDDEDEVSKSSAIGQPEGSKVSVGTSTQLSNVHDETSTKSIVVPRPMAHRTRYLKAKRMVLESPTAVAEILGISGSTTPAPSSSQNPASTTPAESADRLSNSTPVPEQDLTTATKSVADYFKEKLAAKAASKAGLISSMSVTSASASKSNDLVPISQAEQSNCADEDRPRFGIGVRPPLQARDEACMAQHDDMVTRLGFKRNSETVGVVESAAQAPVRDQAPNQGEQEEGPRKRIKEKDENKRKKRKEKKENREESEDGWTAETTGVETTSLEKRNKRKSKKQVKDSDR